MSNENEFDTEVAKSEELEEATDINETDAPQEETATELKARLKRAEAKIERMKINSKAEEKLEKILEKKTGELDETQLDYLDLKGITEEDDIKILAIL